VAFQWLEVLDAEVAAEARRCEAELEKARFAYTVRCLMAAAAAALREETH
jgi:hypothetical protein